MRIDKERNPDVRALLGMQSTPAWILVGFYVLTFVFLTCMNSDGARNLAVNLLAVFLVTAGAVGLLTIPGDPLPIVAAIGIAALGPVTSAMVLWLLPRSGWNWQQPWPGGAAIILYAFMCVRGRTMFAWIGMTAMVAVYGSWTASTGQGAGVGIGYAGINYAPLLMATVFAYTIRPAAKSVFELRDQGTQRAAADAASTAMMQERDQRLNSLDVLARPILDRIAAGAELTKRERRECGFLEAQLRDSLRATTLAKGDVVASAQAARSRGVQVVMLDDHGMDDIDDHVQDRVRGAVARELNRIVDGKVTIRIQPPGRAQLATILVAGTTGPRRLAQIDHDGNLNESLPLAHPGERS